MQVGDCGYVMVGSICRHSKILTISECGRYFRVLYRHCSKVIQTTILATDFHKSWHRAKEIQNAR